MKKLFTNLKVAMTLLLLCGVCSAWAGSYTITIDSSNNGKNNVHWTSADLTSLTYDNITWSTSVTGTSSVTAQTAYCQIGSKNNPATEVSLSTTGFAGKKITEVAVTCYCMSNTGPTLTVTAGSTAMIDAVALTKTTSTTITSPSGSSVSLGSSDAITITFNSSAKAAICISEITVEYEDAAGSKYTVTYNGNGATSGTVPTDAAEYEKDATVTVLGNTGNLALSGYNFNGWNTKEDATGTDYAEGSTFAIQQNTTLYAKWNAISYTITKTPVEGGSCSVKVDDTEVSTATKGTKLTLSNTPAEGYKFEKYVIDYTREDGKPGQSNNTTGSYTMPASDITIKPIFAEKQQYSVAFYDKGELYATANVYEGETLAEALSDVQEPVNDNSFEGYSFQGWSTSQDVDNLNIINGEYIINANTELYAIFGKAGVSGSFRKVTSAPTDWSGNYLIVYDNCEAFNGVDETLDYFTVSPIDDVISTLPEDGVTVTINKMADGYSLKVNGSDNNGKYMSGKSGSNTIVFGDDAVANTISISGDAVTIQSNSASFRYNKQKGNDRFRFYKTATTGDNYVLPQLYKEEGGTADEYSLEGPQIQNVKITSVGYATACIPFNATVEGATAYYVTIDGETATLNEIEGTIPAKTGVIIKGTGRVTFTESAETLANVYGNCLVGSVEGQEFKDGVDYEYYIFAKDDIHGLGFYKQLQSDEITTICGSGKAVLKVETKKAGAKSFFLFDETVGIENVNATKVENPIMYNLAGQRVTNAKGIVIINGKKVIK